MRWYAAGTALGWAITPIPQLSFLCGFLFAAFVAIGVAETWIRTGRW